MYDDSAEFFFGIARACSAKQVAIKPDTLKPDTRIVLFPVHPAFHMPRRHGRQRTVGPGVSVIIRAPSPG